MKMYTFTDKTGYIQQHSKEKVTSSTVPPPNYKAHNAPLLAVPQTRFCGCSADMNEWCQKAPLEWQKYVHKEVTVTAAENQECTGWVFTVDPVSASVVLVNLSPEGSTRVTVVMGHAVQAVRVIQEAERDVEERLSQLFSPARRASVDGEEVARRGAAVRAWLEQNRLPVSEEGDGGLCVAGVLSIHPPYGAQDCVSSNQIILARIQGLLQNTPGLES